MDVSKFISEADAIASDSVLVPGYYVRIHLTDRIFDRKLLDQVVEHYRKQGFDVDIRESGPYPDQYELYLALKMKPPRNESGVAKTLRLKYLESEPDVTRNVLTEAYRMIKYYSNQAGYPFGDWRVLNTIPYKVTDSVIAQVRISLKNAGYKVKILETEVGGFPATYNGKTIYVRK